MPRKIAADRWMRYVAARFRGDSTVEAARAEGIDLATAHLFDRGAESSSGHQIWLEHCQGHEPFNTAVLRFTHNVLPNTDAGYDARAEAVARTRGFRRQLPAAAEATLDDLVAFRERYFGRETAPWGVMACRTIEEKMREAQEDRAKVYILVNVAPGAGKTTLFNDFCAQLTVKDRAITGLMGSRITKLAEANVARLRREFERQYPLEGARATLSGDFGLFKPDNRADKWQEAAFVVVQEDGQLIDEKEPTWQAFGFDSKSQRGFRVGGLAWWDDIVDEDIKYSPAMRAKHEEIWDNRCETRLNPGAALAVSGQLLDPRDLYDYIERKEAEVEDDVELLLEPGSPRPKKYTRILFKAHDETRCTQQHGTRKAPPPAWPESCLLDPARIPWVECKEIMRNKPDTWAIQYQCEEGENVRHVVQAAWVDKCWDNDRGLWELPEGIGPTNNVITVDPSGTNFWAAQAWAYHHAGDPKPRLNEDYGGRRILLALSNRRMEAPELLGFNNDSQRFWGLLEEWRQEYARLGRRLHMVVVEENAAQRYLLQQELAKRWQRDHGIRIIGHTTGRKLDPDLGIWIVGPHWEHGRVRLPGRDPAVRDAVRPLVEQVTTAPYAKVTDQMMAEWFFEANLHLIYQPPAAPKKAKGLPTWWNKSMRDLVKA